MSSTKISFLKKLKSETQEAHNKIEQSPLTRAIVEKSIRREEYAELLKRFLRFYAPCEKRIRDSSLWQAPALSLESRQKSPLLEEDLEFLGYAPGASQNLQDYGALPQLQEKEAILGYLYVVEGSTLGGQIMGRSIADHLGLAKGKGASFFNSYGKENLAKMWRSFQYFLEDYVRAFPETQAPIIESAQQTFEKLNHCLNQASH